jgi:hypothetical protein
MEVLTGAVAIVELLTMAADTAAIIYKWAVKIYKHYQEDSNGVTQGGHMGATVSDLNPILHTWFRDSYHPKESIQICDGF